MWTIPGKEYSYGPRSESRFAQAVCTGIAPDYTTHAVTESRRGKIRNILWKKKGTDKMNKLSQGERANITELSVE